MDRSTFRLSALLLAGLLLTVVAPTASAQSVADCPNTVRVANGCDDYVPARAAQPTPQTAAPATPAVSGKSSDGPSQRRPGAATQTSRRPVTQNLGGLTFYTDRASFD